MPGSLEASLQAPESRKPQVHRAGRSPDTAIPQGDPAVGAGQARGHPSPRLLRSQTPPRPHSLSLPSRVRGLGRGHPEEGARPSKARQAANAAADDGKGKEPVKAICATGRKKGKLSSREEEEASFFRGQLQLW